jgi:hypothetical protein
MVAYPVRVLLWLGTHTKQIEDRDMDQIAGSLIDLAHAKEVQARLREYYPEEHHANCNVLVLFRAEGI